MHQVPASICLLLHPLGIEQALVTLEDVNGNVTSLQNSTIALSDALNAVADDVDTLASNCMAMLSSPPEQCSTVNGSVFRNALLADFTDVCLSLFTLIATSYDFFHT